VGDGSGEGDGVGTALDDTLGLTEGAIVGVSEAGAEAAGDGLAAPPHPAVATVRSTSTAATRLDLTPGWYVGGASARPRQQAPRCA
jgi:hypothetical protein